MTDFGVPEQAYPLIYTPQLIFDNLYIYLVGYTLVLVALFIILILLIRTLLRSQSFLPRAFQKTILLVTVPKESADVADKEENWELIKSQIAIGESWLSTLGGQRAQRGLKAWFFGRSDYFSMEIVVRDGLISFYVGTPRYLRDYIEQQILAQYPEANVAEIQDYNIFSPTGVIVGGYFKFTRDYIFPLKTYETLQSDSLNSITGSLTKIEKEDGAAIQIVARSAKKVWHLRGTKVAGEMQKGKSINEALNEASFFNISKWFKILKSRTPEQIEVDKNKQQRPLSQMEQDMIKGIEDKTSKAGLDCNIRIIVSAKNKPKAQAYLAGISDSFSQFNFYQYGNSLKFVADSSKKFINNFIYRDFLDNRKMILSSQELASVYHFPTPFLDTPNIRWLLAKKMPIPVGLPEEGLLLGENIYRGIKTNIYLKTKDRQRHMYMIGMTGTGKSWFMANLAIQDIRNGKGVCVIDPHGATVEDILATIPRERIDEVVYFNPADTERPIGLNMLEADTLEEQDFAIQEMIAIFYKLVTDPSMIGPMFEHNMRNAMLTLMADKKYPGTIAEIPRIFTDKDFQKNKLGNVTDPMVRSFWEQEMAKTSDFHKSEMLGYLISKIGRFIENQMIRNIIGQTKSGLNFREIMDSGKILLVNLNKGKIGEINSNLLGLIIVAKLQMAALARADMPEAERKDFYLYIDEFQNFITDSISVILAEARKYRLNLILAHQYIGQLTGGSGPEGKSYGDKIKDAIFGNVGSIASFRIGTDDAEDIAKQMAPVVNEYDLINIERYNAYVRLLVDNQPVRPFNIHTFPIPKGDESILKDIKDFSRWKYGADRRKVEADILKRSQLGINKISGIEPSVERSL